MSGVLELPSIEVLPSPDPVVLRKERGSDPEALRGAVQRTMSADCGVVRAAPGLQMAADTLADLAPLADDLPARQIATYEVINLLRVSRAIVAAALAARSRAARTRAATFPAPTTRWLGRLVVQGGGAPRFVGLPAFARGRK